MPNVTIKLITVQLCKEVKIEKMKKTQEIIENYEEKLAKLTGKLPIPLGKNTQELQSLL